MIETLVEQAEKSEGSAKEAKKKYNQSQPVSVKNARALVEADKANSDAGNQTNLFLRAQDKKPRVMIDDVMEVVRKEELKNKKEMKSACVSAKEVEEKEQATQFPEEITRLEADKLWFQDSTIQQ